MLPAVASRFSAAISVMQSIAGRQELQGNPPFVPATSLPTEPSARARANEAVSAVFSVHHPTSTELMIKMVQRIGAFLNDELEANVDQESDSRNVKIAKQLWRTDALQTDYRARASKGELAIQQADKDSYRDVARLVLTVFNYDYLVTHKGLKKELEDTIGFQLNGVSVLDVLYAASFPENESLTKKVEQALKKGLTEQMHSTDSPQLEKAAQDPVSVDPILDDAKDSATDSVAAKAYSQTSEEASLGDGDRSYRSIAL